MANGNRNGPRERLLRVGPEALSDAELIALLFGTGSTELPVTELAGRVLAEAGGLSGLERMGAGQLAKARGVGVGKACRVVAALEIGRRVACRPLEPGAKLASSQDVDAAVRARLARAQVEQFLAIPLDAKNRAMGELRLAMGGLTACPVAPADVFRALLREAAAAVVFVHNHPSGEPSPSPEDVALTERLRQAGDLLGVRVVDHVIVGREGYFSFLDAGLLGCAEGRP
ncbi:MAG: RadC family protein [Myxococcota bacterium]